MTKCEVGYKGVLVINYTYLKYFKTLTLATDLKSHIHLLPYLLIKWVVKTG